MRSNYSTVSRNNGFEEDLFIHNASAFDNGWLSCIASNLALKNKSTIAAPKIIKLSNPEHKFFWCIWYEIIGFPEPKKKWYWNGKELKMSASIEDERSPAKISWKVTGCLMIKMTHAVFNGRYTLVAENEYGSTNKTVYVNLNGPTFKPKPPSVTPVRKTLTTTEKKTEKKETEDEFIIYIATGAALVVVGILMVIMLALIRRYRRKLIRQNGEVDFPANSSNRPLLRPHFHAWKRTRSLVRDVMPLSSMQVIDNPHYLNKGGSVITHVTTGHILDCPPRVCSEEVYKIMLGCWRQEPQGRFTMKTVYYHIDRLCMSQPTYLDLIA
ncbi:hypothetical protein KUTeg_017843 [Tegillarca granosa]|uniref:Ig-like domain-containing protein n=1 Tax=Tegillarca granosa TaxID=220873 RepID=A0ABQ9ELH3_TEGGR|nr:hypothetical protein KUTeg_017843 [Tegillarca granosa]